MIQTIKQNKKAVLAFLLALVMVIGLIPFTSTEVQAVTIPVGDITTNDSFGNGDAWETGDKIRLLRWADDRHTNFFLTAEVAEDGAVTWTPDKKLYWDGKGEHTLVASYPNMNLLFQNFQIPVDQSDLQKLKEADCMNAMWKGDPTTDPINLILKHRLSMVTVTYTFASEFAGEPDITPEVYNNTQYVFFNVNTLDRQEVALKEGYDAWVKAYKHNEVDDEGNVTARKFTAIVSPDAYSAGDDFIRITVGDHVLTAKMPNDITFQEGTHYTFNITVGKDKVEIDTITVNGDFPGGWENEVNLNADADVTVGTPDKGKNKWENGDLLAFDFTSDKYGDFLSGVKYENDAWSSTIYPKSKIMTYLENETPTVSAIYSPGYTLAETGNIEWDSISGVTKGKCEFIKIGCTLSGTTITADFTNATRNYSRLRIVGLPNQTLTVTTMDFTPAGATESGEYTYNLTTDDNGNAFLYGTFAAGATVNVKQGDVTLKDYAFTASTELGTSYVLAARPIIISTLAELEAAIKNGGEYMLGDNIHVPNVLFIDTEFILHLNGKNLIGEVENGVALWCRSESNVTILGEGELTNDVNSNIINLDGGITNIAGGTFEGYVTHYVGTCEINGGQIKDMQVIGGTCTVNDGKIDYLSVYSTCTVNGGEIGYLNVDLSNGRAIITGGWVEIMYVGEDKGATCSITGGSFGFDPTSYVDEENYTVTNNGDGTWTVTAK